MVCFCCGLPVFSRSFSGYAERNGGRKMRAASILCLLFVVGCGQSVRDVALEADREMAARNYGRAAALYSRAMEKAKDRAVYLPDRTDAYLKGGDLALAEADCEARIKADKWDARAHFDLGRLRRAQKRYPEAAIEFVSAERLDKNLRPLVQEELGELVALMGLLKPEDIRKEALAGLEGLFPDQPPAAPAR